MKEIIITLSDEQAAVIGEKETSEIINYANGLVIFYADQAKKVVNEAEAALDLERLAVLKADEVKLAEVDEAIAMKVAEPIKVVEDVVAEKVEVKR